VSFSFAGFPEGNNTITENIKDGKKVIYKGEFSFNGPNGSNTVPLNLSPGPHEIKVHAGWTINGVHKEKDAKAILTCGPPPEPAFTIEKKQTIFGSGKPFTTAPLEGNVGETVDYEIIVKDTGNTSLKFSKLTDTECEGISPSGEVELAPGGEQIYTCEHLLTVADQQAGSHENSGTITGTPPAGQGSPIMHTSNTVVVTLTEPSFTIEKLQRLQGGGSYTTAELTGKIGQTVEYEIIVKNTGNTSLKFSKLTDANCEGISPSGEVEVAAGGEQVYTCSHVLDKVGKYTNEASITGNEGTGTKTSNKVTVNVPSEPSFTIEKQQRLKGEAGYTTSELTGEVGETVEYKIIVQNTGNTSLKFGKLTDANCEGISPSGEVELAPGGEQVYTCSHVLTTTGKYGNTGTITGTPPAGAGSPITHESNEVVVDVTKTSFTIEKQQRLKGEAGYTTSELNGEVGQTVEYKIIVKNTGTTSIKFSKLTDAKCEGISPSGEVTVAGGGEQVYTCSHVLTTTGKYGNTGTITGAGKTETSNEVVVNASPPPTCPAGSTGGSIEAKFNGTKVNSGEYVYFNSVLKPHHPIVGTVITFMNQKIKVKLENGKEEILTPPNSKIEFFATAKHGEGSTEFNGTEFVTRVPVFNGKAFEDNIFAGAFNWKIPAGVQIANAEVTWEADITVPAGVELQWQWAAAVYSTLPGYNEMEIKPLHSTNEDKYNNGDQAGTPENPTVQANHTEGARGGSGSNYTGSYSGTVACPDPPGALGTEGNPESTVEEEPIWLPWPELP
jgi:uncharacterized repeat protein (TIGR01451 family)